MPLNSLACGSSPPPPPPREQMGLYSFITGALHPRKQGSWPPLICCRTQNTTSTRPQEPREEMVTYCLNAKESKVTVQHRPGSVGLVKKETDDTPLSPSPLPRDCSRGRVVALSG